MVRVGTWIMECLHRFGHHARHGTLWPLGWHRVHPHEWVVHNDEPRLHLGAEVEAVDGQGGVGLSRDALGGDVVADMGIRDGRRVNALWGCPE